MRASGTGGVASARARASTHPHRGPVSAAMLAPSAGLFTPWERLAPRRAVASGAVVDAVFCPGPPPGLHDHADPRRRAVGGCRLGAPIGVAARSRSRALAERR